MNKTYSIILKHPNLISSEKTVLMYLSNISIYNKASISLIEISEAIGITKPTVVKALHSLEEKGLIKKSNEGKRYSKNIYELIPLN